MKELEIMTGTESKNSLQMEEQLKRFPKPAQKDNLNKMTKKSYAESTRKKALWAAQISDQWKCICNFKIKQDPKKGELIQGTLLNLDIAPLCDFLCLFLMEIRKQNRQEYPRETLYEIVLSL